MSTTAPTQQELIQALAALEAQAVAIKAHLFDMGVSASAVQAVAGTAPQVAFNPITGLLQLFSGGGSLGSLLPALGGSGGLLGAIPNAPAP